MGIGIYLGRFAHLSWPLWSILAGSCIILGLLRNPRFSIVFLHLAVACIGAFYFQNKYFFNSDHVTFLPYEKQRQLKEVEGQVDSDVQWKPTNFGTKQVFELEITQINLEDHWQKATGRILINFFQPIDIHYGDHLSLEGKLFKASSHSLSKFSYQQYLEDHGLFFNLSVGKNKKVKIFSRRKGNWFVDASFKIKHAFKTVLTKYLDPLEANMIQAMVLGDRSFLTKDMYALFSKTGTSHILAISGMNMAIISTIVLFLLKTLRFSRKVQFVLAGVLLIAYAFLSGWSSSVVRSVLMATVILSSFCLEHESDGMNSLGLAAIVLLLLNPLNLFDVGFQLSFICVAVIVSFYPVIHSLIQQYVKFKILKYFAEAFGISLIAWIGITPLIVYEFDILSPIAIIANLPIVPLADLVIALSLGLVILGSFCPFLAAAFAGSLKVVFNFMLILISWFAQVPCGYFYVHDLPFSYVFIYYLVVLIVYLVVLRKTSKFLEMRPP